MKESKIVYLGLKRGDITPQHLYQQLANPAMQPRHRDLLLTILKMQGGPSPRGLSPVPPQPPHSLFHQQQQQSQQQLRVSPLQPNGETRLVSRDRSSHCSLRGSCPCCMSHKRTSCPVSLALTRFDGALCSALGK